VLNVNRFQNAQNGKITALYERLSNNDDERKTESLSIAHQKQMLETYAQRNGFGKNVMSLPPAEPQGY